MTTTYLVTREATGRHWVFVEAETEEDAIQLAHGKDELDWQFAGPLEIEMQAEEHIPTNQDAFHECFD
jgi:hypothetical protein